MSAIKGEIMEFEVDTSSLTEEQIADLTEALAEMAADPAWNHEIIVRMPKGDVQ